MFRIKYKLPVIERQQKGDQVDFFGGGQDNGFAQDGGEARTVLNAGGIMVDHLPELFEAAVVHVGE